VLAATGRYGQYVKCGTETRSIPEGQSALAIDLHSALALLAQPKAKGRFQNKPTPIQVLGKNAEGQEVKLMNGRYGPYVTDGTFNASLPKSLTPAQATLEKALQLLRERAEKGPSVGKKSAKRTSGGRAKGTAARGR
jgi:DNA topoisomerase-1